ncbi:hypothetical protein ABZ070_02250 [Streptomyces sp. NPDC006283]|uniref:hypothetical protein n=1 Tax=Streptomyces sp. NPDC006283 TaxID=3156741 RepID=UPI0033AE4815
MTPTDRLPATAGGDAPGRPARPAGYWERVERIVDQAPPLDDTQRARLRVIFHQSAQHKEKAA